MRGGSGGTPRLYDRVMQLDDGGVGIRAKEAVHSHSQRDERDLLLPLIPSDTQTLLHFRTTDEPTYSPSASTAIAAADGPGGWQPHAKRYTQGESQHVIHGASWPEPRDVSREGRSVSQTFLLVVFARDFQIAR